MCVVNVLLLFTLDFIHSFCLSLTEQQASSASSLHLPHRCVLQRCEERHGQHCLPGTQDPPRLSAQVQYSHKEWTGGKENSRERMKEEERRKEETNGTNEEETDEWKDGIDEECARKDRIGRNEACNKGGKEE